MAISSLHAHKIVHGGKKQDIVLKLMVALSYT